MKKLAKTLTVILFLALVATSLFGATENEYAVLRMTAYIPENTSFNTFDDEFVIASNAHNFTYAIQEMARTKMLFVFAN